MLPDHAINLAPFARLVRNFIESNSFELHQRYDYYRVQVAAITALREATEDFFTAYFERCAMFVAHAGRVTLMPKDMALARTIWNMDKEQTRTNTMN